MLFRKMLRDMGLNKTQFISIFIMTILGVVIYAGVSSEWNGLDSTVKQYYSETNFPNAWVYSTGFSEEAEKAVSEEEGITDAERRLSVEGTADYKNKPSVKLHFVKDYKLATFKLIEGEDFSEDKDGIWLDQLFAEARGLRVGDKIKITFQGITLEKVIKGLVISPEYVYYAGEDEVIPVRANNGYGFLSIKALPKEVPIAYNELLVTSEKNVDAGTLEDRIDKALGGKYSVYLARKYHRSYMQFSEEIKEHRAVSQIFPVAFLAVAMLTIITTMARLVNNQRTQIGILKAIGFKKRRILFHYISYGFWISLAGAVIGAIVGPLTIPYLFYGPMKTTFTLPYWKSKTPVSVFLLVAASVIACALVTFLACHKVLKDTPSESLRPKAPKTVKHSIFDRMRLWKRLSFHSQWNLRDALRCKGRSAMAIVGVLGCTALLICAFSMQDTFQYVVKWNYDMINKYESRLELADTATQEQIDSLLSKYGGEKIEEGEVELKANGKKKSGELLVTDQNSLIGFVDENCNEIQLPKDQVSISYKMAQLLNVAVGDEISWHIYGEEKWNSAKIGDIYRTPLSQGITMTRAVLEKYGYSFRPTAVVSGKDLSNEITDKQKYGITKIRTKHEMIDSYNTMSETMNLMVYILMIAAVILAAVVIYNLGVLSFTERQRELATLKVIGFKTKKLRTLLLTQNIWLTTIGIIPGIPVGLWMLNYIFRFLGEVFDFFIVVSFSSYVYSIIGTMLVSILLNRLFSKRVKEIDMVSSLKGIE